MKQITIITGPTASGKTKCSLEYAKKFEKAIIINADASAVYANFPILTAQPSLQEKKQYPHLLFEVCDIMESFSVAKWLLEVEKILHAKEYEGFHKIIVGGTCMYIFLLINGLIEMPQIRPEIRRQVTEEYEENPEEFTAKVLNLDSLTSRDKQRLINNYSLILQTGKTFNWWQNQNKKIFLQEGEFELIKINPPREELYENCNKRFFNMLEMGAMTEVKRAIAHYGEHYNFKKILCANEIKAYLQGEITFEEMAIKATQLTRNLAKSQVTWLNNKL